MVPELEDEENDYHELYRAVRDDASVCTFCSGAFGVEGAVADAGVVTPDDHDGHPSIRSRMDDGYEAITYQGNRSAVLQPRPRIPYIDINTWCVWS